MLPKLWKNWVRSISRAGPRKYSAQHRDSGISLADYSEQLADYMHLFTNYLKYRDVLRLEKKYQFCTSFRHTKEYYASKLRSLLKRSPSFIYSSHRSVWADGASFFFLKYVSNVTLFLEKMQTYQR
jgi:hypothetical protein